MRDIAVIKTRSFRRTPNEAARLVPPSPLASPLASPRMLRIVRGTKWDEERRREAASHLVYPFR